MSIHFFKKVYRYFNVLDGILRILLNLQLHCLSLVACFPSKANSREKEPLRRDMRNGWKG